MAQDVAKSRIQQLFAFPKNRIFVPGTSPPSVTAFVCNNRGTAKLYGGVVSVITARAA